MECTLNIDVIGKLWMGGYAAMPYTVKVGNGPFLTAFDDPRDMHEVWHWIDTNTGDFASVTAVDVTYIETESESREIDAQTTQHIVTSRVEHLASFTDEECGIWNDCHAA